MAQTKKTGLEPQHLVATVLTVKSQMFSELLLFFFLDDLKHPDYYVGLICIEE